MFKIFDQWDKKKKTLINRQSSLEILFPNNYADNKINCFGNFLCHSLGATKCLKCMVTTVFTYTLRVWLMAGDGALLHTHPHHGWLVSVWRVSAGGRGSTGRVIQHCRRVSAPVSPVVVAVVRRLHFHGCVHRRRFTPHSHTYKQNSLSHNKINSGGFPFGTKQK